jgi:hypothetical protein
MLSARCPSGLLILAFVLVQLALTACAQESTQLSCETNATSCPCAMGCRRCLYDRMLATALACEQCESPLVLSDGVCKRACDEDGGFTAAPSGGAGTGCIAPATPSIRLNSSEAFAIRDMEIGYRSNNIQIMLRTLSACGQLLFIGPDMHRTDYLALTLQQGHLHVSFNLGGFDASVSTSSIASLAGLRLNDGFWHNITVTRRSDTLRLIIDSAGQADVCFTQQQQQQKIKP